MRKEFPGISILCCTSSRQMASFKVTWKHFTHAFLRLKCDYQVMARIIQLFDTRVKLSILFYGGFLPHICPLHRSISHTVCQKSRLLSEVCSHPPHFQALKTILFKPAQGVELRISASGDTRLNQLSHVIFSLSVAMLNTF